MKSIIFGASRKVLNVLNRLFKNLVQWIDAFVMGGWNCPGHTIHTLTIISLLVVNPLKKVWVIPT